MASRLSSLTELHLRRTADFYDQAPDKLGWGARGYRQMLAHYFNLMIPPSSSVLEIGCGGGHLLELLHAKRKVGIDISPLQIERARRRNPDAEFFVQAGETLKLSQQFEYIIISDTLNYVADVHAVLEQIRNNAGPSTRLIVNVWSVLWRPLANPARWFGLQMRHPKSNWLSTADIDNLLRLSDWERVFCQDRLLVPLRLAGLEVLINRWIAPWVAPLCLTVFCVARPRLLAIPQTIPRVSVVIPVRNEAGTMKEAVEKLSKLDPTPEIIFVEGGSSDDSWEKIVELREQRRDLTIIAVQQNSRGKADAVRVGFQRATGEILAILDGDLSVAPEELPKFIDVIASGKAELANGVRLIYPMEGRAMPFLNLCANKVFSVVFTWLLGQPVKDTLCGTKVLTRAAYQRIDENRQYFGDFDPFGDFDLLFGAAKLNLKIADIPIRYQERRYGKTNIRRWRHGMILMRMMLFAARKLKFV